MSTQVCKADLVSSIFNTSVTLGFVREIFRKESGGAEGGGESDRSSALREFSLSKRSKAVLLCPLIMPGLQRVCVSGAVAEHKKSEVSQGLEGWLSHFEHLLLFQRNWVPFPAPT